MIAFLSNFHPIVQALFATIFTWGMTAVGAASIFLTKEINRKLLDILLGFAAGVMIAASYWSLLAPAIEIGNSMGIPGWLPAAIGFMSGGLVLFGIDKILPHLHLYLPKSDAEGIKTTWRRQVLLMLAITIHNLPEGLAVGVAFGAAAAGLRGASLSAAVILAVGIGLQNLPEGLAVAAPLRREGLSRRKSFWYGQLSAIVEPVGGVLGAATVIFMRNLMPYALSFAAGAMIYVVIEELIPESQHCENSDAATLGALFGFTLMMILDVSFGG
jgi:ZIP family zinc transporter